MRSIKGIAVLLASVLLAACGGGKDSTTATTGGTDVTGGTTTTAGYSISLVVERSGASVSQITSTETVQAVATVTTSSGSPVEGVVVSFNETGASLLKFAPTAATALTGADGKASVDLGALDSSQTGATSVGASATVASVALTATKSIQITAGATSGGTPPVPAAINFVGSSPSDTAIVIKGAGGSGRSESAILTFRVVDLNNAPINGATVTFSINADNGGATISPSSAVSNSSGLVTTTVSSGSSPASIVVTASAGTSPVVSSQSDTLIVSNSVPVAGGFEIVAEKYNLDGLFTGDSTKISAYVRDQFGNPVPDGVAVNFQTDYGAVASSTLGGCTTVNGVCSVDFRVEEPRGPDGIATVIGTVRVGTGTTLTAQVQINMADAPYVVVASPSSTTPVTQLTLTSCKQSFELYLSDGSGHAPAAGTTISAPFASTGATITVKTGSPVLDQLGSGAPPVLFGIEVDLTSTDLAPVCNTLGASNSVAAFFRLEFKTPHNVVFPYRLDLAYPH